MSDETTLADRGDDVKAMSDEELVEALETLAAQFCHETGFATMPVKLHGLEIRHRLESLRERVEELEVIAEAVCQLDAATPTDEAPSKCPVCCSEAYDVPISSLGPDVWIYCAEHTPPPVEEGERGEREHDWEQVPESAVSFDGGTFYSYECQRCGEGVSRESARFLPDGPCASDDRQGEGDG